MVHRKHCPRLTSLMLEFVRKDKLSREIFRKKCKFYSNKLVNLVILMGCNGTCPQERSSTFRSPGSIPGGALLSRLPGVMVAFSFRVRLSGTLFLRCQPLVDFYIVYANIPFFDLSSGCKPNYCKPEDRVKRPTEINCPNCCKIHKILSC